MRIALDDKQRPARYLHPAAGSQQSLQRVAPRHRRRRGSPGPRQHRAANDRAVHDAPVAQRRRPRRRTGPARFGRFGRRSHFARRLGAGPGRQVGARSRRRQPGLRSAGRPAGTYRRRTKCRCRTHCSSGISDAGHGRHGREELVDVRRRPRCRADERDEVAPRRLDLGAAGKTLQRRVDRADQGDASRHAAAYRLLQRTPAKTRSCPPCITP